MNETNAAGRWRISTSAVHVQLRSGCRRLRDYMLLVDASET
jgi:hypothetical protein